MGEECSGAEGEVGPVREEERLEVPLHAQHHSVRRRREAWNTLGKVHLPMHAHHHPRRCRPVHGGQVGREPPAKNARLGLRLTAPELARRLSMLLLSFVFYEATCAAASRW